MSSYSSEHSVALDKVAPGARLAPLIKRPTPVDVVMFCAAIRNFHRFHFDQAFTQAKGIGDLIVPGFLMGNWCIEAASRAFSEPVHIRRLRFKNIAVAPVGGIFTIEGEVASVGEGETAEAVVCCRFDVRDQQNRVVTTGEVEVTGARGDTAP